MRHNRKYQKYGKRYFLFRAGAILLGLLPFLVAELTLHLVGWQPPDGVRDPYIGFTELRPLFEENVTSGRFEIATSRYPLFCPDSFLIDKPQNEFRIFCVGGSTVQGRPFAHETAFSTWLELSLRAADPATQWRVINCGGVSYASYRLAPIVDEIMAYEPDLLVLYTGHNEFLEDRTYGKIKATSPWVMRTHERLSALKSYSFLRNCFVGSANDDTFRATTTELPGEVEARLDFRGGLAKYARDDLWQQNVVRHFEHNLKRMVNRAIASDVPVFLCNPVANLKDAAPFKSQNGSLGPAELAAFEIGWQDLLKQEEARPRRPARELELLQSLVQLDPRHAETQFRIGQAYLQLGNPESAKHHLVLAKDEDICPLRIIEAMYDVIAKVKDESGVPLIDIKGYFESRAPDGIPGRELLLDHVHPTIHGHQIVARILFNEMVANQMVVVSDSDNERFDDRRESIFQAHLESLPYMYFELGKDRLAGLKRWSEGRVTREKDSREN